MNLNCAMLFDTDSRLEDLGFRRIRRLEVYRRGELYVSPGDDFWTVLVRASASAPLLSGRGGQFGLWKLVERGKGKGWEFHLPASLCVGGGSSARADSDNDNDKVNYNDNGVEQAGRWDEEADDASGEDGLLRACLEWAESSLDGEVRSGWRPPEKTTLEQWLGKDSLTVQAGPLVRQGMVLREERRLAVRFPLVYQASGQLSPARRQWLDQTLRAAQNRWRMARVVYGDSAEGASPSPAVSVEIDFTGAPKAALECLLKTGVDGLRWAVSWLLWPVGFMSDPSVTCSAWEIPPDRAFGPRKGGSHA